MARVELIIKGEPQDHVVRSGTVTDEVAAEQLASVGGFIGRHEFIKLPWLVTTGAQVRYARVIADEPTVRASAGGSIMGDVANERF